MARKSSAIRGIWSQAVAGRDILAKYDRGTGGFFAEGGFVETMQDVQPFREGCPFGCNPFIQCGLLPFGGLWEDSQKQTDSKIGSRQQEHLPRVYFLQMLQGQSNPKHRATAKKGIQTAVYTLILYKLFRFDIEDTSVVKAEFCLLKNFIYEIFFSYFSSQK